MVDRGNVFVGGGGGGVCCLLRLTRAPYVLKLLLP